MKIDTLNLTATILRGARVAYEMNNDFAFASTFERWLGSAQQVAHATGRAHIAEQLAQWCLRALDGEARVHPSELTAEDHAALIVALHALSASDELARMADVSAPMPFAIS